MSGTSDGRRRPFQIDEDGRDAGARVAAQEIEALGFLQLALEPFGDLLQGVVERRAGPGRLHDHGPEGESRVLAAAEPEVGGKPGDVTAIIMKMMKDRCFERPFGKIGAGHEGAPSRRTFWPGCSA